MKSGRGRSSITTGPRCGLDHARRPAFARQPRSCGGGSNGRAYRVVHGLKMIRINESSRALFFVSLSVFLASSIWFSARPLPRSSATPGARRDPGLGPDRRGPARLHRRNASLRAPQPGRHLPDADGFFASALAGAAFQRRFRPLFARFRDRLRPSLPHGAHPRGSLSRGHEESSPSGSGTSSAGAWASSSARSPSQGVSLPAHELWVGPELAVASALDVLPSRGGGCVVRFGLRRAPSSRPPPRSMSARRSGSSSAGISGSNPWDISAICGSSTLSVAHRFLPRREPRRPRRPVPHPGRFRRLSHDRVRGGRMRGRRLAVQDDGRAEGGAPFHHHQRCLCAGVLDPLRPAVLDLLPSSSSGAFSSSPTRPSSPPSPPGPVRRITRARP